jgi:potassium efflux system protein
VPCGWWWRYWPRTAFWFSSADRLRSLFAPLPGLHRLLLLAEALAIVLFAVATLHRLRDFGNAPGEGVFPVLLYFPPLSFLASLGRHRGKVIERVGRGLRWIALAAWATHAVSRLSRFALEEEIFPRVRLERGLPYTVLTTVHYAILVSGLILALTAIGVDMTKVTIVAGALTVGIGFGLQNIVNNFVSGLIVLFERPVKVGDTIQIDDIVGRVLRIGIRATVIHSTTGAEVIIPNGKLISDKVTNWTLSSQLRQVTVPVVTKPDIDVGRLTALLTDLAHRNRNVLETPAPEVLFAKRGIDAYEFELRFRTSELDAWLRVRSDLTTEINEALRNSEIPTQAPLPDNRR